MFCSLLYLFYNAQLQMYRKVTLVKLFGITIYNKEEHYTFDLSQDIFFSEIFILLSFNQFNKELLSSNLVTTIQLHILFQACAFDENKHSSCVHWELKNAGNEHL